MVYHRVISPRVCVRAPRKSAFSGRNLFSLYRDKLSPALEYYGSEVCAA